MNNGFTDFWKQAGQLLGITNSPYKLPKNTQEMAGVGGSLAGIPLEGMTQQQYKNLNTGGIPNYPYSPYQVKRGDTFESIASNASTGLQTINATNLQEANNGMLVPPPSGSFVNIPNYNLQGGQGVQMTPPKKQPAAFAPPNILDDERGRERPAGYTGSFTSGSNVDTSELTSVITAQLAAGTLPPVIPFQVSKNLINPVTGRPFTDMDYLSSGMTYNNQKKQWENPNTPEQTSAAVAKPANTDIYGGAYIQVGEVRWERNKKGRLVRVRYEGGGKKSQIRGNNRGASVEEVAALATNAGASPSQQLQSNVGGG